jgi:photosystem II stability/assembly factor-like uncharacterized protein
MLAPVTVEAQPSGAVPAGTASAPYNGRSFSQKDPMRKSVLLALILASGIAFVDRGGRVSSPLQAQDGGNVIVNPNTFQDLRWRSVGPHRGGRSTAAAGVRTQPNVFYMGATGGGVWKTENYGITWTPISDGQIATGSIGAIDVSDSNPEVIYVGTGSEAIRSNVILGRGVYKSADAGKTWQFAGLREVGQIGQLKVHPKNPDIAYVAAVGNPFAWGPDRGVYRTKDGGKTWQKVLFINDQTGAVSVAINWSNPNEIYAGAWRAQRKPWTIISGGPAAEGGVYKSTDGGDKWTRASAGFPDDLVGKVWVDVAQSNPKVVYAQVEAKGDKGGLYRSIDAGASWTIVNSSPSIRARPFYFNKVFVNPKDEHEVYVTELGFHRSTDGGRTFSTVPTPHGDDHVMWINPDNPKIFIETNDGGANITVDNGKSWSTQMNQPTAEFYMVDTDEQFPYRIYGPQQDNSTVYVANVPPHSWPSDEPTQTWFQASGCESGQIRPRPDGKIIYGDCKGEFGRYNVETGQEQHYWIYPQQRYGKNPKEMRYRFVRQAPIEVDARHPAIVYHGSQYVHKTVDGGIHWTRFSPDVTANTAEGHVTSGEPITRDMTGEEVYAALYSMRSSRLESGVFWTGSNDGPVWMTRDGGRTWKNVTPAGLPPGGRVHTIEDSPHRRGSAYVSVYRMYLNDFKPYLYMTNDYGQHWTLLTDGTNGIPGDQPMHVVREDPQQEGLLYAGTLEGAYVSFDQGKHWQTLQKNLPATPVTDLKVHHDDLVVSTMGRSFWIMDNVAPLRQIAASVTRPARTRTTDNPNGQVGSASARRPLTAAASDVALASQENQSGLEQRARRSAAAAPVKAAIKPFDQSNVFLFTPSATYRTRYVAAPARPDRPEYPPVGARIDYYLASPSGEVKLEMLDAAGTVVRSFSSEARAAAATGRGRRGGGLPSTLPTKAGMNRFVWDLQYAGGPPTAATEMQGGGGGGGPLVAPGTYRARLTAGGVTRTEPFTVRIDPRVAKDGVTVADLVEQTKFSLKVRDALAEARQLSQRVRQALDAQRGDQAKLRSLHERLVTKSGPYEDQMFIDQLSNVNREISQADQKVGASAYERFTDLMKEWTVLKTETDAALR